MSDDDKVFNPAIEGRYEIRDGADETILHEFARTKDEAMRIGKQLKVSVVIVDTMRKGRPSFRIEAAQ